ncbi:hemoglobin subunit beta-2-like [Gastrophryne carolinensis]
MVHFTEQEMKIINTYWPKLDPKGFGGEALIRLLCVDPWTQRYFVSFGNLGSCDAIAHNAKLMAHGEKVANAIGDCLKHLDNLKAHLSKLSNYHCDTLHIDPANFDLFADCLTIVMAEHFKQEFTADVQCAFKKAFHAVAKGLAYCYH